MPDGSDTWSGDKTESLHTALINWYARPGDETEAQLEGYRIDVVRDDLLIEIQTRHLGSLRHKLTQLVRQHKVLVVYPIPETKWLVYLAPETGEPLRRRRSPKRGRLTDLFGELVYLGDLLNHPNLALEALLVQTNELRQDDGKGSWRRKGVSIVGHRLIDVVGGARYESGRDLAALIPDTLEAPFTNRDLATALRIRIRLARKMSYSLRRLGVIEEVGKQGRELLFARAHPLCEDV
jgi:hypothetical protein